MNLAIRGIDSSQVKWNNEGSFLNDAHKDLKADYIIANPPFNVSDSIERVKELDYVLTPGRYVGLPDDEDDFDFKERVAALKAELEAQLIEEAELNKAIAENLRKVEL